MSNGPPDQSLTPSPDTHPTALPTAPPTAPDVRPITTIASAGEASRRALGHAIAGLKATDPLAPVTVAPPTPYAGLTLRHHFAGTGGFVNVRFMALHRIAELLGAPFLIDGRRPLTPAHRREATRLSVERAAPFDASPRTVDAVVATLERAAHHGIDPVGVLGDIARERSRLLANFYDDEDQLFAAADVITTRFAPPQDTRADRERPATPGDLGTVIWYLPGHPTPGALAFATALADADLLHVITTAIKDPLSSFPDAHHAWAFPGLRRLGLDRHDAHRVDSPTPSLPLTRTREQVPVATDILVAADRDTEVRAVASRVLDAAQTGTPFHRIAVTCTHSSTYLPIIHERFAAADIPMAGPSSRTLAQGAAGRLLVGWLRVLDEDVARGAVVDVLDTAPLRPGLADERVVAHWDRLSSEAGIVAGAESWSTGLAALASRRDDARAVHSLADTVALLVAVPDGWGARCDHALAVLEHLLGDASHLDATDQASFDATRDVLSALAALDGLGDDHEGPAQDRIEQDLSSFSAALQAALDVPDGRVGTVGTGVLVAGLGAMVGADFDHVFILGLDDAAASIAATDDSLLAGQGVAGLERYRRREAYLGAITCAPARTITVARCDQRGERALAPNPWVLESANVLAGRPVSATELLDARSSHPWLSSVDSFASLVRSTPPGIDEARLAALLAWRESDGASALPIEDMAVLVRSFEAVTARADDRAGHWDGVIGSLDGLAPNDERPMSATSLEAWALCPFRYFLRSVLRLHGLEHPEQLERIDPRERGTLVHDALATFVGEHVGRSPTTAWSDADRQRLAEIVDVETRALEAAGRTGHPALWAVDRRDLDHQIEGFLDTDEQYRAQTGVSPLHVEIGFGTRPSDVTPLAGVSRDAASLETAPVDLAPLDIEAAGHRLRVRGRIDRVDISPDGRRVEVIDYKTGTPVASDLDKDPVAGGTSLQPVLYGMVMRREHPDATVGFRYWYTKTPDDPFDGIDEITDAAVERLHDVVATISTAASEGLFPREPGEDGHFGPTNCSWCDYARVCPNDRVRIAKSRVDDPAFDPLWEIRQDSDIAEDEDHLSPHLDDPRLGPPGDTEGSRP